MKVTLICGSPKKKGSASETLLSIIKMYLTKEDFWQEAPQKEKQRSSSVQKERRKTEKPQIKELQLWQPQIDNQHIKELLESESIVFAFPLYIDSIPSHLLRCLMQIEDYIHLHQSQQEQRTDSQTAQKQWTDSKTQQLTVNQTMQDQQIHSAILSKINIYVIVNNGFFQGKQNVLAVEVMQHWAKRCGFCFRQAVGIGGGGMINMIQSIPDGHGPKKNISIALKEMAENIIQSKSGAVCFLEPNYPAWAYKWQAEYMWRVMIKKNGLKKKEINKQW